MGKKKLELPKPKSRAVVVKPGERLKVDMSMVPHTTGESLQLSFRADPVTLQDIEEHLRRIEARAPGVAITLTDAVRSLVQRGAEAYREDERNESPEDK